MDFLKSKIKKRIAFIKKNASINDQKDLINDLNNFFCFAKNAGVKNENDYKDLFYITTHINKIATEILNFTPDKKSIAEISNFIFNNRENKPINTILGFYEAASTAIHNIKTIKKKAYPQGFEGNYIKAPHNLTRWVDAMKEIYILTNKGINVANAFNKVTEKWDVMDKKDFKHWLDFYESGAHLSYKTANNIYYDFGGAQIPIGKQPLKAVLPKRQDINDLDVQLQQEQERKIKDQEQKNLLNDKIKQLIGRLNSAEKIYTSYDFQKLLGSEHEAWLATLHQLKRKIQTSAVKNASTVDDLICRFNNQLKEKGLKKIASVINKIAQPAPPAVGEDMEFGMDLSPSTNLESSEEENFNDPNGAINEFLENIGVKPNKEKEEKDREKIYDVNDSDDIIITEEDLYKKAQELPTPTPTPTSTSTSNAFNEDKIDEALKGITLSDVIVKLEGISQLYKNRPLASELNKVDFMLQHLDLAPYFPNMAEAIKSALDSNQYVLTRIEDILAKLRGANAASSGQLDLLKNKLEQSEENSAKKREQKEISEMSPTAPETELAPTNTPTPEAPSEIITAPELKEPTPIEQPKSPGVRV